MSSLFTHDVQHCPEHLEESAGQTVSLAAWHETIVIKCKEGNHLLETVKCFTHPILITAKQIIQVTDWPLKVGEICKLQAWVSILLQCQSDLLITTATVFIQDLVSGWEGELGVVWCVKYWMILQQKQKKRRIQEDQHRHADRKAVIYCSFCKAYFCEECEKSIHN